MPFKEALARDKARNRPVGEKVLKRFYSQYFYDKYVQEVGFDDRIIKESNGKPNCIVIDLDGTTAIHRGRLPFDWDKIPSDFCDPRIKLIIEQFNYQTVKIIFLTGRPDKTRIKTNAWLNQHFPNINYSLLMREDNDFRSGEVSKRELWEHEVEPYYNTLCVFEDSNKCVDMWRELGLLTCQVANGEY